MTVYRNPFELHAAAFDLLAKAGMDKNLTLDESYNYTVQSFQLSVEAAMSVGNDEKTRGLRSVIFMTAADTAMLLGRFEDAKMLAEKAIGGNIDPHFQKAFESIKERAEYVLSH